jgi:hypothetical protein
MSHGPTIHHSVYTCHLFRTFFFFFVNQIMIQNASKASGSEEDLKQLSTKWRHI